MFKTIKLSLFGLRQRWEFDSADIGIDVIQLLMRLRHEDGYIMFEWSDGRCLVLAHNDCMEFHIEIHGESIWIMNPVDADDLCRLVLDGADLPVVEEFCEARGIDP